MSIVATRSFTKDYFQVMLFFKWFKKLVFSTILPLLNLIFRMIWNMEQTSTLPTMIGKEVEPLIIPLDVSLLISSNHLSLPKCPFNASILNHSTMKFGIFVKFFKSLPIALLVQIRMFFIILKTSL